jgi:sugar phosphate isomerase/epimerase
VCSFDALNKEGYPMNVTRRDFSRIALSALPAAAALSAQTSPNSKIDGVQIGAITYSFRQGVPKMELPAVMAKIGLSEVELMSGDAEAMAGAPARAAGRPALVDWRAAATAATWQGVRKQFNDAGIAVEILCYNMGVNITDDEMDYAFRMAQAMGVRAISSSSTVTVAKRVAPFAEKYKILWGGHGHANISDPEQFATEKTFETIMSFSKYIGANLDVGHYNQTGADAVAFVKKHHDRITNLHIKDSTKPTTPGASSNTLTPWGEGDAPIKEVLLLMKNEHYTFPANIEFEYTIPPGSDAPTEVAKCYAYVQNCLKG